METTNQSPLTSEPSVISPPEQSAPINTYGKKNWKKWIVAYIVIAIVICAGTYAFVLLKKSTNTYSTNYPRPTTVVQPTNQPIASSAETANWKTYTDEQSGYSMKYPVDWIIDPNGCSASNVDIMSACFSSPDLEENAIPIVIKGGRIAIYRYKFKSPVQDFNIDDFCKLDFATGCKQIKLDQMAAWQRNVWWESLSTEVVVLKDGKMFLEIILAYTPVSEKSIQSIFNQILSTFKFTDSSSLKTYNNGKFSFSYPSNMFVYEYKDVNNSVAISDIQNPNDIPLKVSPEDHTIIQVGLISGIMPSCFPYTNGGIGCVNSTIKPYRSTNGYSGIRGNQTSTLGLGESVYLKKDNNSYTQIFYEIGDKSTFEQILSTFKFTD